MTIPEVSADDFRMPHDIRGLALDEDFSEIEHDGAIDQRHDDFHDVLDHQDGDTEIADPAQLAQHPVGRDVGVVADPADLVLGEVGEDDVPGGAGDQRGALADRHRVDQILRLGYLLQAASMAAVAIAVAIGAPTLVVFVLAEVFREGARLRREAELTI